MRVHTMKQTLLVAAVTACAVVVSSDAQAGWVHMGPSADRIVVNLRGDIITQIQATKAGAPVGGIRPVGRQLIADVPVSCSGGSTLLSYAMKADTPASQIMTGKFAGTSVSVPLILDSGSGLSAACSGTSAGTKTIKVHASAFCYKQGVMPPLDTHELASPIQIIVVCDPNYRAPVESVPTRWRHTCPAGYSVGSTGQQTAETSSSQPLCVKNGTTGEGPKG